MAEPGDGPVQTPGRERLGDGEMTTTNELRARFTTRAYERDLDGDINAANAWRIAAAELGELADPAELLREIRRGMAGDWTKTDVVAELVHDWLQFNGYELGEPAPVVPADPVCELRHRVEHDGSRRRWDVLVDDEHVATLRWSGEHMVLTNDRGEHVGTLYRSDGKITGHDYRSEFWSLCGQCQQTETDGDHPRRIAYTWRAYARRAAGLAAREAEVARGVDQAAACLAILANLDELAPSSATDGNTYAGGRIGPIAP